MPHDDQVDSMVALLVSAWIEIANAGSTARMQTVALLVSAWIEIDREVDCKRELVRSHSL